MRQQFFWHRFFQHQPDLNYDNPAVQDAMIDIVRYWLERGIDGFAWMPRPTCSSEKAPTAPTSPRRTTILKRIRKIVDDEYPGRVLLAEANLWPTDLVAYFGDHSSGGDECHMAFHFPLMPRMFMALRRENRLPVTEIIAQTPQSCRAASGARSCVTTTS